MPTLRTKQWYHQRVFGSQRGDGGNSVWTDSGPFVNLGFFASGWTLVRTFVRGYFSVGVIWNPADQPPFFDVIDGMSIELGVFVDTSSPGPITPPPLSDNSRDSRLVWDAQLQIVSSQYLQNFGDGRSIYTCRFVTPDGPLSESSGERGPAAADGGNSYLQWSFSSNYVSTMADFTSGYNVGGVVFDYMLAGSVTVDELFLQAPE